MTGAFNLFGLRTAQFETLLLVLVRVTAMLSLVPIFSQTQIPHLVRFGIGLLLAFVLVHDRAADRAAATAWASWSLAILAQLFIGLVFGFVAFLVFTGIQFAGEIIDIQIGFAVVNIINPLTSQSVTVIGEFQLALATLLYLAADAHHALIAGIAGSFQLVPLPFAATPELVAGDVVRFFTQALFIVFEIAAPVAIALFLVNVMLGLMARVAPQMNVFVVGFPIQIIVGLIMLIVAMPLFGAVFPSLLDQSPRQLDTVLRAMGPAASRQAQRRCPAEPLADGKPDADRESHSASATREARKRGQVARSQDISGAAIFLAIIIALHLGFMPTMDMSAHAFAVAITHAGSHDEINSVSVWGLFSGRCCRTRRPAHRVRSQPSVIAFVANILAVRLAVLTRAAAPKFSKLNPISGFKRIFFSPQTLVQLAKQLLKLGVVIADLLAGREGQLDDVLRARPRLAARHHRLGRGHRLRNRHPRRPLAARARLADYIWERRHLEQSLKMTKTEVKRRAQAIRRQPRVAPGAAQPPARDGAQAHDGRGAQGHGRGDEPDPLRRRPGLGRAQDGRAGPHRQRRGPDRQAHPRAGHRARHPDHGEPAARPPLYDKVELDSPVPPDLYAAVAQVIAFVYKLKNRTVVGVILRRRRGTRAGPPGGGATATASR